MDSYFSRYTKGIFFVIVIIYKTHNTTLTKQSNKYFNLQELNLNGKDANYFCIIRSLFNGFVKYPNTKKQSLINSSIIINCEEIQEYLLKIHNSLEIKKWIIDIVNNDTKTKKYQPIGKIILNKIRKSLDKIISDLTKCTNDNNNSNKTQQIPIIRPPQIFDTSSSSSSSYIGTRKTCSNHSSGLYLMCINAKIKIYNMK